MIYIAIISLVFTIATTITTIAYFYWANKSLNIKFKYVYGLTIRNRNNISFNRALTDFKQSARYFIVDEIKKDWLDYDKCNKVQHVMPTEKDIEESLFSPGTVDETIIEVSSVGSKSNHLEKAINNMIKTANINNMHWNSHKHLTHWYTHYKIFNIIVVDEGWGWTFFLLENDKDIPKGLTYYQNTNKKKEETK